MPGMPEVMAKPLMLERLDEVLSQRDRRNRFLNDLRSGRRLIDVAIDHRIARSAVEKRHLREDWFRSWWPAAQAHPGGVEAVMRSGLIAAIEEAKRRQLPVDCYWVCDPGHGAHAHGDHNGHPHPEDGEVEVTVSWSRSQITFILQTPHPPVESRAGPVNEPIWVIKRMPDHSVGKVRASRPAQRVVRLPRPARRARSAPRRRVA